MYHGMKLAYQKVMEGWAWRT